jgi:hypothetical protein
VSTREGEDQGGGGRTTWPAGHVARPAGHHLASYQLNQVGNPSLDPYKYPSTGGNPTECQQNPADPTLAPTVSELERTPAECHLKRDSERSFWPKAHPKRPESKSPPLLRQPSKPHTYNKHSTRNHPQTFMRQLQTRQNNRQPKRRCSP